MTPEEIQELREENIVLREKLNRWEEELSTCFPYDCKDWWSNNRDEWPEVARMTIEGLKRQVDQASRVLMGDYEE